jgi:hypothetical protein
MLLESRTQDENNLRKKQRQGINRAEKERMKGEDKDMKRK